MHRAWDVAVHPEWLVFEAEGRLQVRPTQYLVAAHLLAHPGAIVQLNMGEGKTRVIMPLLVLHWTKSRQALVRLNLLPALLDEAYAFLHTHLCASVLRRKLFVLPFQRDVEVTPRTVLAMRASLNLCQREGGLLLVAPEHRLSLLLKRQELWQAGEDGLCASLDAAAALPYLDLLDESDEVLHHRFQLIYAWGTRTELPALPARAHAAQALLHIVSQQARAGQGRLGLAAIRPELGVAVLTGVGHVPGAYLGLRLLAGGPLQGALPVIHTQLAEALVEAPPYEMRWMKGHPLKV